MRIVLADGGVRSVGVPPAFINRSAQPRLLLPEEPELVLTRGQDEAAR